MYGNEFFASTVRARCAAEETGSAAALYRKRTTAYTAAKSQKEKIVNILGRTLLLTLLAANVDCGIGSSIQADLRQENKPASAAEDAPPYIIEQYATTVRFENDGTSRRELDVRARVLSEEGAHELSRLAFEYDRKTEQLDIGGVEIRQASGGSIGVLPHAIIDKQAATAKDAPAYQDAREKSVRIPALKIGDTLQYTVTLVVTKPPAPGDFWLEHKFLHDAPVKEEVLEINVPRDRAIKLATRDGSEPANTTDVLTEASPRRIFKWRVSRRAASLKSPEPLAGHSTTNSAEAGEQDIQISTFLSWEDLGRWYQKRWEEPTANEAALETKVAEITGGRETPNEKLAALYTFVSQKIRTIELAADAIGYRTLPAAQVLAQGYGTPLDKHMLLAAMAKTIGLRAIPVLVARSREISENVPSPAQFNHLVSAVQAGGQWAWLDTAPQVAPFRMLAANLRNRRGLAIQNTAGNIPTQTESTVRPIQWMTTPADPPFPATQKVSVSGEVTSGAKLTARVQYIVRGDTELLLRVAFHGTPRNQWKNLGQLLALSDGFRGDVTNVVASNPDETEKPFEVEYRIVQEKVLSWKDQKARVQLPLPSLGLPDLPAPPGAGKPSGRSIELGTPLSVTAVANISLPRGVTVSAPFPVNVKRDYAEYRSTYRVAGSKVEARRELRFLLRELPLERAGDYTAFVRTVRNDEAQQIVLDRPAPDGKPSIPSRSRPIGL
jgi:hypothetical protein